MARAWVPDTAVESTGLDTTGGHTWKAAYRLADFLEASAQHIGLNKEGLRVLELGSGTGWLGITLARNLPNAALVCLTEQEAGLPWLQHNVQLNHMRGLPLGHVRVQHCDWLHYAAAAGAAAAASCGQLGSSSEGDGGGRVEGRQFQGHSSDGGRGGAGDGGCGEVPAGEGGSAPMPPAVTVVGSEGRPEEGLGTEWDVIVGSDLIYNQVGSRCLPRVLQALAGPATQVFYCHTKHRYDLLDMEFFEELAKCGLCCEEVREPGMPPPPESPPLQFPPAELFPEHRIAVYRITKQPAP